MLFSFSFLFFSAFFFLIVLLSSSWISASVLSFLLLGFLGLGGLEAFVFRFLRLVVGQLIGILGLELDFDRGARTPIPGLELGGSEDID